MDAAFRGSGLYRKKWDEKRGAKTDGQLTIARAIESCQDVYDPVPRAAQPPDGGFKDAGEFFAGRKAATNDPDRTLTQGTGPAVPAAQPAPRQEKV